MKKLLVLSYVICGLLLSGCLWTSKSYMTINEAKLKQVIPKSNGYFIECNTERNLLWVNLYLDKQPRAIKNIEINIVADNQQDFKPSAVEMYWGMQKDKWVDKSIRTNSFIEIPEEYKTTSIDGTRVHYTFNFISSTRVRAKNLNINILVLFKDGMTQQLSDDYKPVTIYHHDFN